MNGAGDQLFAGAGFAQNEHRRIHRRHLRDLRQHFAQRFGGTDDLLEHRGVIDFLAQRQVFFLDPLFSLLAVVDIDAASRTSE